LFRHAAKTFACCATERLNLQTVFINLEGIMKFCKSAIIFAAVFAAACANSNTANKLANAPTNTAQSQTNTAKVDELAASREIYSQKCVRCHQENGAGGKIQIEDVELRVPTLRDAEEEDTDADYIRRIERGATGKMPAFKGKLTDEEIKNLVRYIRRDFQGK